MENVKVVYPPPAAGWLEIKLSEEESSRIDCYIKNSKDSSHSVTTSLAGNISKSDSLIDEDNWFLNNVLLECTRQYCNSFPIFRDVSISSQTHKNKYFDISNLILDSFWVNYQKQYEFNPLHQHTGLFSFVIWKKMPVEWVDQIDLPHCKFSNSPSPGDFNFVYTDILGNIDLYRYPISKKLENVMLFFPSILKHQVNPFYDCQEDRISISGNLILSN